MKTVFHYKNIIKSFSLLAFISVVVSLGTVHLFSIPTPTSYMVGFIIGIFTGMIGMPLCQLKWPAFSFE